MAGILSIAYFPPVSWFSLASRGDVLIEAHENYQKQSWRNRCNILTGGGVEMLQVPVVHRDGTFRHPIRQIKVDWSRDWLLRQKRAIDCAYRSSAYFDHYRDGLYAVMDRRPELLWNLDMSVIEFFCNALGIAMPGLTASFACSCADIHPKHPDHIAEGLPEYFQVFAGRYGFVRGLSIMDLLFNEGPQAALFL